MLNQIKTMEPLSATVADTDGDFESFLAQLDAEVQVAANEMTVELLYLLLDKWENDIARLKFEGKLNMEDMLNHYVRLKISLHHLKRYYEREFWPNGCYASEAAVKARYDVLVETTKKARINYYVAKREFEGEHGNECSCRGCRCLGAVSPACS